MLSVLRNVWIVVLEGPPQWLSFFRSERAGHESLRDRDQSRQKSRPLCIISFGAAMMLIPTHYR